LSNSVVVSRFRHHQQGSLPRNADTGCRGAGWLKLERIRKCMQFVNVGLADVASCACFGNLKNTVRLSPEFVHEFILLSCMHASRMEMLVNSVYTSILTLAAPFAAQIQARPRGAAACIRKHRYLKQCATSLTELDVLSCLSRVKPTVVYKGITLPC